jgi:hypothetical protein
MNTLNCLKMIFLVCLAAGEVVLAHQATPATQITPEQIDQKVEQSGACQGHQYLQKDLILNPQANVEADVNAVFGGAVDSSSQGNSIERLQKVQAAMACANDIDQFAKQMQANHNQRQPANAGGEDSATDRVFRNVTKFINHLNEKMNGGPKDMKVDQPTPILGVRG